MSIQIIDNFNLNVSKPIDDRFVVGSQSLYPNVSYNDKNDIPYKYPGLRVWDLNVGIPYYWNGTIWASENSVSISGSGSASYVPRFVGSGTSVEVGNSNIYIIGNSVGINNTNPNSLYSLDVIGGINSTSLVSTNGLGIQQLNASNISTGIMSLARLANNTTNGWILTSGVFQPTYVDPSTLTVGVSSASVIFNETASSTIHYVGLFNGSTGNLQSRVSSISTSINTNSRQLTYQPSTGILASATIQSGTFSIGRSTGNVGSAATPGINFRSATNTGIYYLSSTLTMGLAVTGVALITMESGAVNFGPQSAFYPRVRSSNSSSASLPSYTWYGNDTTGIFRPASNVIGISTNGVERVRFSDDGISMVSDSFITNWTVTSLTSTRWVSNLAGSTSASAVDLASTTYDRIIYGLHGGAGDVQVNLYAETTTGSYALLNRSAPGGFNGTMMILPAGKQWRCNLDHSAGSATITFYIYKLGR